MSILGIPLSLFAILVIILLGIIHIFYDLRKLGNNKQLIGDYFNVVVNLADYIKNKQDYSNEVI